MNGERTLSEQVSEKLREHELLEQEVTRLRAALFQLKYVLETLSTEVDITCACRIIGRLELRESAEEWSVRTGKSVDYRLPREHSEAMEKWQERVRIFSLDRGPRA